MFIKRLHIYTLFTSLLATFYSNAQDTTLFPITRNTVALEDNTPQVDIEDINLNNIITLRDQFERQNKSYSIPSILNTNLLRFFKKDELQMSDEALYWARYSRDPMTIFDDNITFRDTVIVNPIFLPVLFRGNCLPENLTLYNIDCFEPRYKSPYSILYKTDTIFPEFYAKKKLEDLALQHIEKNYPTYFRYSVSSLPKDVVKTKIIKKPVFEDAPIKVEAELNFSDVEAPAKFIPDRKYWRSNFESAIQFSQNHVSKNWYKGGSSNLNIFTKNYLKYDYNKDKVQLTNELEIKSNVYNAPKDSINNYKIGDDLFRIHSNIGYKAFSKWYYTLDGEFKTQLFSNFKENTKQKQAALLSPFSFNLGLGMKYDLVKAYKTRHKNLKLSINLAPFSYTYMHTIDSKIDLGRHGFKLKENSEEYNTTLSKFGSTIRLDMNTNFSRNISWQSRFYYFTTYENSVGEFENTLILGISRFFSTRVYCHIRYDDGAKKTPDSKTYFQVNELLSFGFNYRW